MRTSSCRTGSGSCVLAASPSSVTGRRSSGGICTSHYHITSSSSSAAAAAFFQDTDRSLSIGGGKMCWERGDGRLERTHDSWNRTSNIFAKAERLLGLLVLTACLLSLQAKLGRIHIRQDIQKHKHIKTQYTSKIYCNTTNGIFFSLSVDV